MTTYGISHADTINSYWYVNDAINKHPQFNIAYLADHNAQHAIAQGFAKVSKAGFKCCARAIDGILIWIHKPSKKRDCTAIGCDEEGKFFCGRKKKCGLNCQAVRDVRGQILDISILYPGSTSDCLAFKSMSLFRILEECISAPGLCLFGNNAYLNTTYMMATPYSTASGTKDAYNFYHSQVRYMAIPYSTASGTKDPYNFYHSQVRIWIECAFGMSTKRWPILRSAIPVNVTVPKTVALVFGLAKLHNFIIDAELDDRSTVDLTYIANDEWSIELNGGVPLVTATAEGDVIPQQ